MQIVRAARGRVRSRCVPQLLRDSRLRRAARRGPRIVASRPRTRGLLAAYIPGRRRGGWAWPPRASGWARQLQPPAQRQVQALLARTGLQPAFGDLVPATHIVREVLEHPLERRIEGL